MTVLVRSTYYLIHAIAHGPCSDNVYIISTPGER